MDLEFEFDRFELSIAEIPLYQPSRLLAASDGDYSVLIFLLILSVRAPSL